MPRAATFFQTCSIVCFLALSGSTCPAFAGIATGYVTPSEVGLTITKFELVTDANQRKTLFEGTFERIFRKADSDFASTKLTDFKVPYGRYVGFSVTMLRKRAVKLNGDKYVGKSVAGGFSNGEPLWSIGSGSESGGVTNATAPSPTTLILADAAEGNPNDALSTQGYFAKAVCIKSATSDCPAGDVAVAPGSSSPRIEILVDLANVVPIDGSSFKGVAFNVPLLPLITFGAPGAAIHLSAMNAQGDVADITLLFDGFKRLVSAIGLSSSSSFPGFCPGVAGAKVSAVPSDSPLPAGFIVPVLRFDETSGKVQYAVSFNCQSGFESCSDHGVVILDSIKKSVGENITVTCVPDQSASPPFLGFTYTGGTGVPGATVFTVKKVVDPGNLLGTCPAGTCGSYP